MFRPLPVLVLVVAIPSLLQAGSATQSDWSGGPGVPGPVIELGAEFDSDTNIEWSTPGHISPLQNSVRYWVDGFAPSVGSVRTADFDSDGDLDAAGCSFGMAVIYWWENTDGQGIDWTRREIDPFCYQVRGMFPADVDNDGDFDLVGANYLQHDLLWWENSDGVGGSWDEHFIENVNGVQSLDSSDVDGDGDIDIMGATSNYDELVWWENVSGSGDSWSKHYISASFQDAFAIRSGDIDGDGDPDAVAASLSMNGFYWFENDGTGAGWTQHGICTGFTNASFVAVNDMDLDGDLDAAGTSITEGTVAWFENLDGSGQSWTMHPVSSGLGQAKGIAAGDFDSDGDIDLTGTGFDGDFFWWENSDGSGLFWTEHLLSDDYGGYYVVDGDLNSDGRTDILCTGYLNDVLCYWDINSLFGYLTSSILDTQCDPDWGWMDWTADTPPGTSICFQVRASDDAGDMGAWSDTLHSSGSLEGILADGSSYVQYKAILRTEDPSQVPVLHEVTISWDQAGMEQGQAVSALLPFSPNPSQGDPAVRFILESPAAVDIRIFDVSGRIVHELGGQEFPAGQNSWQLKGLLPGIYFCRMDFGNRTEEQRFLVLR